MPTQRRFKSVLKNLLFAVLATGLFFALGELVARLGYTPKKIDHLWMFEYDKDKVFRLKKNTGGGIDGTIFITNSQGYRDREIPVEKPAGTIRILVLGDSVTFGHGVSNSETFVERLESSLRDRFSSYRFDVVNTAAPGNGPLQEYYDLKRGLKFAPDLIILQFTLNDVVEPFCFLKRYGGTGEDYHGVQDVPFYDYLLSQHSALYLFLKDIFRRIRFRSPTREDLKKKAQEREIYKAENLVAKHEDPRIQEAWNECLHWMNRIVAMGEENDLPCILLVTPFVFQFHLDPSMAYPQIRMKEFAAARNLTYVDVLTRLQGAFRTAMLERYPSLRGAGYSEIVSHTIDEGRREIEEFWLRYFLDHDHLNANGHRFVAGILEEKGIRLLTERGYPLGREDTRKRVP